MCATRHKDVTISDCASHSEGFGTTDAKIECLAWIKGTDIAVDIDSHDSHVPGWREDVCLLSPKQP